MNMKNTTFKRLLVKILAAVTAISCFAAVGCTGKGKTSGTVATDGSTSMAKVIGALGEAFMQANDDIKFTYNPTGSGSGITAVSEGRCDIGLSSRALKTEETDKGLVGTVLAYDGIAIIVHPDNNLADIDIETNSAVRTVKLSLSEGNPTAEQGTVLSPLQTQRMRANTGRN